MCPTLPLSCLRLVWARIVWDPPTQYVNAKSPAPSCCSTYVSALLQSICVGAGLLWLFVIKRKGFKRKREKPCVHVYSKGNCLKPTHVKYFISRKKVQFSVNLTRQMYFYIQCQINRSFTEQKPFRLQLQKHFIFIVSILE